MAQVYFNSEIFSDLKRMAEFQRKKNLFNLLINENMWKIIIIEPSNIDF